MHQPGRSRRTVLAALAGGAASIALPGWAQSSAFPNRSITLICPWPPGGSTDRHLRTLAEIAGRQLGQTIVVENKPGGGGTTGPGTMALTAKPDGYTSPSSRWACCACRTCRRCSGIR